MHKRFNKIRLAAAQEPTNDTPGARLGGYGSDLAKLISIADLLNAPQRYAKGMAANMIRPAYSPTSDDGYFT